MFVKQLGVGDPHVHGEGLDRGGDGHSPAKRVVVLEKALAVGVGGIVGQNVRLALSGLSLPVYDVVAGLGGRPITKDSLHDLFAKAVNDELDELTFLDMDWDVLQRELA